MKYMDIYKKIQNPLEEESVIKKLLEAYAEKGAFYTNLTNRNSKNKERYYSVSKCDELYALLFNTWKKEMLSIPKNAYEEAIKRGLFQSNVYKVLELLRRTPDVSTKKEADAVLDKNYSDKSLADAMEKYRWDNIGLYSGWTHISSRYIHAKKQVIPPIEHRLYINADYKDLHELSSLFLKKCTAKKLPHYFKISEYDLRDDNIVIYSDTKNLPEYIKVLSEIEKERPDIISRCGQPPILTGKLCPWCGYGSEPLSKHSSFNSVRADAIQKAIEIEMKEWYRKNLNSTIQFEGKIMSFYEYISKKVIERVFASAKRTLDRNPQSTYAAYSYEEMSNPKVVEAIEKFLSTEIVSFVDSYLMGTSKGKEIKFKLHGKERKIYGIDIIDELKAFVPIIYHNDNTFGKKVKRRIEIESELVGIDTNNYSFDIENVELLKKADESANESSTSKSSTQKSTTSPSQQYQYKPMTAEEILASQRKIALTEPAKVKVKK